MADRLVFRLCVALLGLNLVAVIAGIAGATVLDRSTKVAAPAFEPSTPDLRDWPSHVLKGHTA